MLRSLAPLAFAPAENCKLRRVIPFIMVKWYYVYHCRDRQGRPHRRSQEAAGCPAPDPRHAAQSRALRRHADVGAGSSRTQAGDDRRIMGDDRRPKAHRRGCQCNDRRATRAAHALRRRPLRRAMNAPIAAFLDTSVLIAATDPADPPHPGSRSLLAAATPATAACGAHTLAEVYAVLSRIPGGKRVRPELAGVFVDQIVARMTVVPLSREDYVATLKSAASMGLAGGTAFDALLMACARKVSAESIYTLNVRRLRLVTPDLADQIKTP